MKRNRKDIGFCFDNPKIIRNFVITKTIFVMKNLFVSLALILITGIYNNATAGFLSGAYVKIMAGYGDLELNADVQLLGVNGNTIREESKIIVKLYIKNGDLNINCPFFSKPLRFYKSTISKKERLIEYLNSEKINISSICIYAKSTFHNDDAIPLKILTYTKPDRALVMPWIMVELPDGKMLSINIRMITRINKDKEEIKTVPATTKYTDDDDIIKCLGMFAGGFSNDDNKHGEPSVIVVE